MAITIVPYDPRWPALFDLERGMLDEALGDRVLEINHIGSTSVPGLSAKPVIDIQLVVDNLQPREAYEETLTGLGYQWMDSGEEHRRVHFAKKGPPQSYNLHVVEKDNVAYLRHILLRDRLREDEGLRAKYERLKFRLARLTDDSNEYAELKTEFIESVVSETARQQGLQYNPER